MTERANSPTAGDDLPRFTHALRPLVDLAARLPASVHTKLLGGFFVGVLLLLAMGAVSLLVMDRMSQQVQQLTQVYSKERWPIVWSNRSRCRATSAPWLS